MNLENSFNKTESSKMHKMSLVSINSNISSEFLSKIISKNPFWINSKDDNGDTFLSYAIKRNNQEIIDLIISLPLLDINYKDNNDNTYLHLAVICKNIQLIKQLLKKRILINTKNKDGNTPLHFAYYINSNEIINLLIENNCDVNIRNNQGLLPKEIVPTDDALKIIGYETNNYNYYEDNCDDQLKYDKKYKTIEISQTNRIKRIKNENIDILNMPKNSRKKSTKKNINGKKRNSKFDKRKKSSLFYNKDKGFRKISNIELNSDENDSIIIHKESENYQFYIDLISPSRNICNFSSPKTNNTITSEGTSEKNNNKENINIQNDNVDIRQEKIRTFRKINAMNLFKKKNDAIENSFRTNKTLLDFLSKINLEKYYEQINKSEFSNIMNIIEETKNGHFINDYQLKNIGINKSGDRAKILIRIQEISNSFDFTMPKAVYYYTNDLNEQIEKDINLNKLLLWLKEINLDTYFYNFVNNGYFSIDLLYIQMESKNPLTDEILKNEILIEKLGYRTRILNKLKEEYPSYLNKLRCDNIVFNQNENNRICSNCTVF